MKKRLRVLKLRFFQWCGFKLTSDERSELAYWITRNVKELSSETLRKVRSGAPIEGFGDNFERYQKFGR